MSCLLERGLLCDEHPAKHPALGCQEGRIQRNESTCRTAMCVHAGVEAVLSSRLGCSGVQGLLD
jgi:hypothetical protein